MLGWCWCYMVCYPKLQTTAVFCIRLDDYDDDMGRTDNGRHDIYSVREEHMPVKDPIELGSGRLYFKGTDEFVDVDAGNLIVAEEEAFTDDLKHISLSMEPITFECKAEFNRNWTLIKCVKCGIRAGYIS